jgi:large subunit ribosomal protein L37Ae
MAMAKRTDKVGSAGKFGPRYGVRVRKRVRDIGLVKKGPHECPSCHHKSLRRIANGIWECRHCEAKFAASAYNPSSMKIVRPENQAKGGF